MTRYTYSRGGVSMPKRYNYSKGGFILPLGAYGLIRSLIQPTPTSAPNYGIPSSSGRGGLYINPPYLPNALGGNMLLDPSRYFNVGSHGYGKVRRRRKKKR